MSYPTPLGPWFVVQRLNYGDETIAGGGPPTDVHMEYYQHAEDGDEMWIRDKRRALLLMSIQQAARIAEAETAEVRCLSSKKEAQEFGRG